MKNLRIITLRSLCLITAFLFLSAHTFSIQEGFHWYKGNLHAHTIHSDGDSPPEKVIRWYKDHQYNFLSLTDHNFLTGTENYEYFIDESFLLIPGNEISDDYEKTPVHLLALGVNDSTLKPAHGKTLQETLQNNVNSIREAGAVPVLAHPNFGWAFGSDEMIHIKDCVLFEVLNTHPSVNNFGGGGYPSTEEMWDQVLSAGTLMFGIGTDDTHKLATYAGKSWIMVRARELTEKSILNAITKGDFYVSTGVVLESCLSDKKNIRIKIKAQGRVKYTTLFIGNNGQILKKDTTTAPVYVFTGEEKYVRAKIIDSNGKVALTQPVIKK